uniref:Perforin 1.9 n=1 Tax=Sphaeramia orbicularis TaxID=375764 RepID=A0A672ZWP9_9TELE
FCFLSMFLILSLPQCTLQSCTEGKPKECQDGFDITKIERKGGLCDRHESVGNERTRHAPCVPTPIWRTKGRSCPCRRWDWRAKQSCSMKVSSKLHRSSESLGSGSTASVENNWKANLDVDFGDKQGHLMLAGTHSKLAEYSMENTKMTKKVTFSSVFFSFNLGFYDHLHDQAVNKLPKIYSHENKQPFYQLIDNFGTHYITKVKDLGGNVKAVTSIRQCQASLKGLSTEEVQMCLEVEASASTSKVKFDSEVKHCNKDLQKSDSSSSFSDLFNDRFTEIKGGHTTEPDLLFSNGKDPSAYKEWLNTLPQNPDIISYSLNSLHELLPPKSQTRKNLRSAISHYILEKGLLRNCSSSCQAGIKTDPKDPCVCQWHGQVIITVQRASGLWGDHTTATDGYVKVFLNKVLVQRSPVIMNNNNPHWGMVVDLGPVDLSAGSRVRFEVWDQDSGWDDDLLGQCEKILSAGVKADLCVLQHGRLFYKWEVKCAPSLGGDSCTAYEPAPMKPSLKRWFVSRHAHPIPKSMLLKMGVLNNERCRTQT